MANCNTYSVKNFMDPLEAKHNGRKSPIHELLYSGFDTKWILLFTIYQFSFLDTRTTSGIEKKYPRLWSGGGENQTITRNS